MFTIAKKGAPAQVIDVLRQVGLEMAISLRSVTDSPGVSSPGLVHGLDGRFLGDALDCVLRDAALPGEFRELTLKSLPLIRRGTSAWVSSVTGRDAKYQRG